MVLVFEEWIDRESLSNGLGVASIASWLCAQLPQLYENYRNSSVEGLAFPFLVSWLFGDATNLIGCVLTHQLPFQTYLASYFVMVDVGLLSQFVYYYRRQASHELPPLSSSYPHVHGIHPFHRRSTSENWITTPHSNRASRKRVGGKLGRAGSIKTTQGYGQQRQVEEGDEEDYITQSVMSESSAYSAERRKVGRRVSPARSSLPPLSSKTLINAQPTQSLAFSPSSPESINNYHYQEQSRGRSLHRARHAPKTGAMYPPIDGGLETIRGSPASGSALEIFLAHSNRGMAQLGVGRELPSQLYSGQEPIIQGQEPRRKTSSRSASRPSTLRRSTTMTFFSIGFLCAFGRWSLMSGALDNVVVTPPSRAWVSLPTMPQQPQLIAPLAIVGTHSMSTDEVAQSSSSYLHIYSKKSKIKRLLGRKVFPIKEDAPYPKRDWERFFGRASAWICTSLYLTSRLPQIWQNFRRRSVEGLSMLLFIFAAIGNTLYVLSILTNPLSSEPGYLLESLPYLLGSGGTLCFDFTIVLQSYLYSENRKERKERERRKRAAALLDADETARLLNAEEGDDDANDGDLDGESTRDSDQEEEEVARRRRSRSASVTGRLRRSRSGSTRPLKRSNSTRLSHTSSSSTRSNGGDAYEALEDREFDFTGDHSTEGRSRTRTFSGTAIGNLPSTSQDISTIPEEGESNMTLRS